MGRKPSGTAKTAAERKADWLKRKREAGATSPPKASVRRPPTKALPASDAAIAPVPAPPPPPATVGDRRVRSVCEWIVELSARLDAVKVGRLHQDLIALEAKYNPPPAEPARTDVDANDGFGPRVLTPYEMRLAALRAAVPTVNLGGGGGEARETEDGTVGEIGGSWAEEAGLWGPPGQA